MKLRSFYAGLAALTISLLGAVVFASPANAATPERIKPWDVTFSDDDCTGLTVVTLINNLDDFPGPDVGLVFDVDGEATAVDAGDTKTVDIPWPQSEDIDVSLSGVYQTPEVEDAVKAKTIFEPVLKWHSEWERPDGCWKTVVTYDCNNTFTVNVENTGPNEADFGWVVTGDAEVTQPLAGNADVTLSFKKGDSVAIRTDGVLGAPFSYVKPENCTATPSPSPSVTPSPDDTDSTPPVAAPLPVTGASLGSRIGIGSGLLGIVGVIVGSLYLRRRRALPTAK